MNRWSVRFSGLLFCFVAFLGTARVALAEEGDGDGPVFLFISLSGAFESPDTTGWTWDSELQEWVCDCGECDCECGDPPQGSPVLIVPIGMFAAGAEVDETTFVPGGVPPDFSFDEEEEPDTHQYAIIGSFDTSGENTVHLVTTGGGAVPAGVQEAFFNASNNPGFGVLPPETTTLSIATFIYDNRGGATTSITEIMTYLFTPQEVVPDEGEPAPPPSNPALICQSPCEAEGELFAHEGDSQAEFGYGLAFDPADIAGTLVVEVCRRVPVDIKPGSSPNSINLKKQGKLTVAFLGSDTLDVTDIVKSTVAIIGVVGGVDVSVGIMVKNNGTLQVSVEDVDGDGDNDLVCHFSVPKLVEVGLLHANSTALTIHAETLDECIEGIDSVVIVTK